MHESAATTRTDAAQVQLTGVEVAALFRRFQPALLRFFERRSFTPADAEDLAQEVFVKITRLEPSANIWQPEAFLFQIAANVLRDKLRRDAARQRDRHVEFDGEMEGPEVPEVPSEESVYEGRESLQRLLVALGGLTPKCRTIFVLHKYEGLSYSEIARRYDITVSAVEKHMINAMKHLRSHWRDRA